MSQTTSIAIDTYDFNMDTSRLGGVIDSSLKAGVEVILLNFSAALYGELVLAVAKTYKMFVVITPDGTEAWIVKNPKAGRPPGP